MIDRISVHWNRALILCAMFTRVYSDKVEVVNVVSETITSPMDRGVVPPNLETVCTHSFKLLKHNTK